MKRVIFCILGFMTLTGKIAAQSTFPPVIDSLITHGIDQTFSCRFDSAMNTFQKVVDRWPDHPIGYFYRAATLQSMMMHYETDRWGKAFYRLIEDAMKTAKKQLDEGSDDPWIHFFMGSSATYKGLFKVKTGGVVSGFIDAQKGLRHLNKALEADSSLYDAYLGLGSFDYWSARFYKYLKWLPWIEDERERGLYRVKLAMEKSAFSYWVSVNSLAWIEYDRQNYEEALALFRQGLERYPGSRFFLWGVGDTYFRLDRFDQAIQIYEDILESIVNDRLNNGYNEVVCRFKLIRSYMRRKNYEKALQHCDAILDKKLIWKIEERVEERRDKTKKYRDECLKALKG